MASHLGGLPRPDFAIRPLGWLHVVLALALALALSHPGPARAQTLPNNATGWCTALNTNTAQIACYQYADDACQRQWDEFTGRRINSPNGPALDTGYPTVKKCNWNFWANGCVGDCTLAAPGTVSFQCGSGYTPTADGRCLLTHELSNERPADRCDAADPKAITANPILVQTGAKTFHAVDARNGNDLLNVERSYRSLVSNAGVDYLGNLHGLAAGWRFDFMLEAHLSESINWGSTVTVHDAGGASYQFFRNQDGSYAFYQNLSRSPLISGVRLSSLTAAPSINASADFQFVDAEDRTWVLRTVADPGPQYRRAKPISMTTRGGYQLSYAYDTKGRLQTITDSFGRQLGFSWVEPDLNAWLGANAATYTGPTFTPAVAGISLPDGTSLRYTYASLRTPPPGTPALNPPDVLVKVERLSGTTVLETTQYAHGDARFPTFITAITDTAGVTSHTVSYDGDGRAVASALAGGVEAASVSYQPASFASGGFTRTLTNALGKQTTYQYNTASYANALAGATLTATQGVASANCPASSAAISRDATTMLATAMADEEGRGTAYVRDANGRPTQIREGVGTAQERLTTITWHATLNVPTKIVTPGLTTDYTWNAGRLQTLTQTDTTSHSVPYATQGQTRTFSYSYGPGGLLLSVDGPLAGSADTTSYSYTAAGFIASVTDAAGLVTTFGAHNGRGQPQSMTDPNGIVTTIAYDALGRVSSLTLNPGTTQAITQFAYTAAGDISRITRPSGAYLDYGYDAARRLMSITDNAGNRIDYTRDLLGGITGRTVKDAGNVLFSTQSQTFDEMGRLLKTIGAAGQSITRSYDKTGNLTALADPRGGVQAYAYDSLSRLMRDTNEDGGQVNLTRNAQDGIVSHADPRNLATSYVRNAFGDIIQEVSPDKGTTTFIVNALGLPTQITDGRGVVENRSYDAAGRLLTRTFPAAPAENITYTWDSTANGNLGKGRITAIAAQNSLIEWTWDAQGRRIAEQATLGGKAYIVAYGYDADGQISRITYPSGRIVDYARDGAGRVTAVTTKANAGAGAVTVASGISWRPFGPLQGLTHGNGLTSWRTYTGNGELDVLLVQDGAALKIRRSHTRTDALNLTNIWDDVTPARNQSFWYNARNQLQNASGPWGDLTWYYDLVGNRTWQIEAPAGGAAQTRVFNYPFGSNRLASVTQDAPSGTALRTFSHDGSGRMTQDVRAGVGTFNYAYNARGRLAQASLGASVRGAYTYDGLERLAIRVLSNVTPAGTTHMAHDLMGRVLVEADGVSGATARDYIWLDDMPLAVVDGGALYHVHADHMDRPIMMTDGTKISVWEAVYRPFGEAFSLSGSATLNLRFPGQWFQLETGLAYNWHRQYDATLGRYIQPDPLGFVDGPSVYAYVKSSPLMGRDVEGLQAQPIALLCGPYAVACGAGVSAAACLSDAGCRKSVFKIGKTIADLCTFENRKAPENANDQNGPKAPGKPTSADGFADPKGGENWVPNPNGAGSGWQDINGDVWVPTGQGGRAHGGPHWDVQTPGGGYRNVRPRR